MQGVMMQNEAILRESMPCKNCHHILYRYPASCVNAIATQGNVLPGVGKLGKQAAKIKALRATNEEQQRGMQEQAELLKGAQEDLATK